MSVSQFIILQSYHGPVWIRMLSIIHMYESTMGNAATKGGETYIELLGGRGITVYGTPDEIEQKIRGVQ